MPSPTSFTEPSIVNPPAIASPLELSLHDLPHELQLIEVLRDPHTLAVLPHTYLHVLAELAIQYQQVRGICALNRLVKVMEVEHVVEARSELLLGELGYQELRPVLRGKENQYQGESDTYEDQLSDSKD